MQGLGKTVESIALVLQRPRPPDLEPGSKIKSSVKRGTSACTAGTLIVTPPSISKQWAREVMPCSIRRDAIYWKKCLGLRRGVGHLPVSFMLYSLLQVQHEILSSGSKVLRLTLSVKSQVKAPASS